MTLELTGEQARRRAELLGAALDSGAGGSVIDLHPERVTKSSDVSFRVRGWHAFRPFIGSFIGVETPTTKPIWVISGNQMTQLWQTASPILRAEERRIMLETLDRTS
jgi:hypothetical protein